MHSLTYHLTPITLNNLFASYWLPSCCLSFILYPLFSPSRLRQQAGHLCGHRVTTSHLHSARRAPSLTSRLVQSVGCRCIRSTHPTPDSPDLCQCTTLLSTAVDPWPDTRQLPPPPYFTPASQSTLAYVLPGAYTNTHVPRSASHWTDIRLYWCATHTQQGQMSVTTPHRDITGTLRSVFTQRQCRWMWIVFYQDRRSSIKKLLFFSTHYVFRWQHKLYRVRKNKTLWKAWIP